MPEFDEKHACPVYFESPAEFERWMEENHTTAAEILVGFHKVGSGRPSMTWPESVDVALCFGWIDAIRRRVDDERYTIRFTPRRKTSNWSNVNLRRIEELKREGRVRPAGLRALETRDPKRNYSYEEYPMELPEEYVALFREHPEAWEFFNAQPPGYRKLSVHRVVRAKQEATRLKKLNQLIDASKERHRLL